MKKRILAIILCLCLCMGLAACGSTSTEGTSDDTADSSADSGDTADTSDDTVYTLKVSTTRGDSTWFAQMYDDIFAQIEEESGGRLQFEIYHNNTLGSADDIWTMFTEGGIDIIDMSPGMVGDFPVSECLNIPFLFENNTQILAAFETLLEEGYLTEYSDNMQVLMFLPAGTLELFTTSTVIESMDDLSGLKLRASSTTLSEAITALGGTAVSVETSEQTTALQQGVLDGVITGALYGSSTGLGDVCPYLMSGAIAMSCMFCGMNTDTWNSLPEDLQTIITDVFTEWLNDYYMDTVDAEEEAAHESLEADGVTIYEVSDDVWNEMVEATSSFRDDYVADLDAEGLDGEAILEIIDEAIAAN